MLTPHPHSGCEQIPSTLAPFSSKPGGNHSACRWGSNCDFAYMLCGNSKSWTASLQSRLVLRRRCESKGQLKMWGFGETVPVTERLVCGSRAGPRPVLSGVCSHSWKSWSEASFANSRGWISLALAVSPKPSLLSSRAFAFRQGTWARMVRFQVNKKKHFYCQY